MFGFITRRRAAKAKAGTGTERPAPRARLGMEGLEDRHCPAGLTVQQFAANLVNVSRTAAAQSVIDIAKAEVQRPTLLANAIVQDAVRIANDVKSGASLVKLFNDYAPLVQHLKLEQALVSAYRLSPSLALANNTTIQNDLRAVAVDYTVTVMFLRDLTAHVQTTVAPTTAPVSGFTQVYSDLNAMGRFGGLTPQQSPALQSLIQSIPSSAWSKDPGVLAVNQLVTRMLGG
jgi:hypothetical protein